MNESEYGGKVKAADAGTSLMVYACISTLALFRGISVLGM